MALASNERVERHFAAVERERRMETLRREIAARQIELARLGREMEEGVRDGNSR